MESEADIKKQIASLETQLEETRDKLREADPQLQACSKLMEALNALHDSPKPWNISEHEKMVYKNVTIDRTQWVFCVETQKQPNGDITFFFRCNSEKSGHVGPFVNTMDGVLAFYLTDSFILNTRVSPAPVDYVISEEDLSKVKSNPVIDSQLSISFGAYKGPRQYTHIEKMEVTRINMHTGKKKIEEWRNPEAKRS